MNRRELLLQVDEMLELSPGTLTGSENLSDIEQWDSLAMMNFIALASEQFGLTLSPRQFAGCQTVNDLMALVGVQSS